MLPFSSRPTACGRFRSGSPPSSARDSQRASVSISPDPGHRITSRSGAAMSERDDDLEGGSLVLSDLPNRVLDKGVVINGHVTLSVAEIDLLELDLRLLLTSVETAIRRNIHAPPILQDADAPVLPRPRGK